MAKVPPFSLLRFLQTLPTSAPSGGGLWMNNGVLTLAPIATGTSLDLSQTSNSGFLYFYGVM